MGRLQGTRCEQPPPDPRPLEEYASYALRLPHNPLVHLQRSPPYMGRLRVVTANCGGLGSDPRKVLRLIAYLACAGSDIAHLQEAGTQFAAAWLAGLPYGVCVGPLFPGGGRGASHPGPRPPPKWVPSPGARPGAQPQCAHRADPGRGVGNSQPAPTPGPAGSSKEGRHHRHLCLAAHGEGQCQDRGRQPQQGPRPPRRRVALQGPEPEGPAGRVPGPVRAGQPDERGVASGTPLRARVGMGPRGPGNTCVGADKVLLPSGLQALRVPVEAALLGVVAALVGATSAGGGGGRPFFTRLLTLRCGVGCSSSTSGEG